MMYSNKLGTTYDKAIIKLKDDVKTLQEFISKGKSVGVPNDGYYDSNMMFEYLDLGLDGDVFEKSSPTTPFFYNNSIYFFVVDNKTIKLKKIDIDTKTSSTISLPSTLPLTADNYLKVSYFPSSRGTVFVYNYSTFLYEYDFINNTCTKIDISTLNNYDLVCTDDNKTLYLYSDYNNIKKYSGGSLTNANLDFESYVKSTHNPDVIKGNFYFFQIYGNDKYLFFTDNTYLYKYKCVIIGGIKFLELECSFPMCSTDIVISSKGIFTGNWRRNSINKGIMINLITNRYMIFTFDARGEHLSAMDYPGYITVLNLPRNADMVLEFQNVMLVTPKHMDGDYYNLTNAPKLSFNASGELVVTINGTSKTFVPKNE